MSEGEPGPTPDYCPEQPSKEEIEEEKVKPLSSQVPISSFQKFVSRVLFISLIFTILTVLYLALVRLSGCSHELTGAPFWCIIVIPLLFFPELLLPIALYSSPVVLLLTYLIQSFLYRKAEREFSLVFKLTGILILIGGLLIASVEFYKDFKDLTPSQFYQVDQNNLFFFLGLITVGIILFTISLIWSKKQFLFKMLSLLWLTVILGLAVFAWGYFYLSPNIEKLNPPNYQSYEVPIEPIKKTEHLMIYKVVLNQPYDLGEEFLTLSGKQGSFVLEFYDKNTYQVKSSIHVRESEYTGIDISYRIKSEPDSIWEYQLIKCQGTPDQCLSYEQKL